MAKLTPLAKGLIALTIASVFGAAAWHLGVKDMVNGAPDGEGTDNGGGGGLFSGGGDADDGPLGSPGNPLKVSIVSFHGYAPGLVANGASLKTAQGSLFEKNGLNVEFVIQDNIPTTTEIFGSDTAHCAWRTSDFWAQEQPALRAAGYDGRAVMVVDNTQGADAIIATDKNIQSVEDLAGKSIALLQFTPSDGMVIDAVQNSSLSKRKQDSIKYIYVNPEEGLAGVAAALRGGNADAVALWDPDLSLALNGIDGAHVIYSTKTATNLIYDVMVCDTRYIDDPANDKVFEGFVAGWMQGVEAAEANPDQAVEALIATEEFFALLAQEEGNAFVKGLFDELVWTGVEDNGRILGFADGGTNHYDRVYRRFDQIYRAAGYLADPNAPVINPQDSFEDKWIRRLYDADAKAQEEAQKPEFVFTPEERDEAHKNEALLTKPITVNFASGSFELTKRSEQTIDEQMVPLIENNGGAYFEVSGNTDSTGGGGANKSLSQKRANAVVNYLLSEWEFSADRFVIVGNGEDKPLCNEKNPDEEGLTLDECQAANRTTRLAILSR
jgi:NitT/TauT family transport system substrate-binding protein